MYNQKQCQTHMETKDLLRKCLITGRLNPEQSQKVKEEIFKRCHMNTANSGDRMNWSNWINSKCPPNRFVQDKINESLTSLGYEPIYKNTES